jgi:t-SNARE complex subunit (syntaxin)
MSPASNLNKTLSARKRRTRVNRKSWIAIAVLIVLVVVVLLATGVLGAGGSGGGGGY